jgi:hypothetical protein
MVPVSVAVSDSDDVDAVVGCEVTGVTNNEEAPADVIVTGLLQVELRADRLARGSGQIYTIGLQCTRFGRQYDTGEDQRSRAARSPAESGPVGRVRAGILPAFCRVWQRAGYGHRGAVVRASSSGGASSASGAGRSPSMAVRARLVHGVMRQPSWSAC